MCVLIHAMKCSPNSSNIQMGSLCTASTYTEEIIVDGIYPQDVWTKMEPTGPPVIVRRNGEIWRKWPVRAKASYAEAWQRIGSY